VHGTVPEMGRRLGSAGLVGGAKGTDNGLSGRSIRGRRRPDPHPAVARSAPTAVIREDLGAAERVIDQAVSDGRCLAFYGPETTGCHAGMKLGQASRPDVRTGIKVVLC
jgi:hypothetical protein